jgi:hypothetical protein
MWRWILLAFALTAGALSAAEPQRFRGALPSPRGKVLRATRVSKLLGDVVPPDNWCQICPSYDMSGNDRYGDCVSAEEGNHFRAWTLAMGYPMTDVAGEEVVRWARKHGYLNGAMLTDVMDDLKTDGMVDKKGVTHRLKEYYSVDYTDQAEVKAALWKYKTLNIAIAADQVEVASGKNGWIQLNGKVDRGIDHCVGLHGYGSLQYLCDALKVKVPNGADANQFCVLLYTWGTVGIVNWKSLQGMMTNSEAWAREPGDVPSVPFPTPTPTPGPSPAWPVLSGQLFDDAGRPIQGTITLILTGKEGAGQFPYIIQRDASGKYSPTPKILGVR